MSIRMIAIACLLLASSTYASGQLRDDELSLRGLQGIRLIVKYGGADGLEETMRPAVLQILQDEAKAKLEHAGIRLQRSAQTEGPGTPRLVFTITLNKPTTTGPAILVESKLYQRVQLWRDPSNEMDVATWKMSGSGYPNVKVEMISTLFHKVLDDFVKHYQLSNRQ